MVKVVKYVSPGWSMRYPVVMRGFCGEIRGWSKMRQGENEIIRKYPDYYG